MNVVLGATTVLANALEWVAAVGRVLDFEAHPTRRFVEHGGSLFDFLADFCSAGVAHPGTHYVVKGQVVFLKP